MTYIAFHAHVKTQYSTVIKCFRCDLGREYTFNKFYEFLALDETIHQISCTDTTKQNSVAERKNKHIVETAHSPLLSASVPSVFWGVVLTVVGLIYTISSSHISGFSPFKKLYGYAPDYFFLEFLVVLVSFFMLMKNTASCPLNLLFMSFLVMVKVKRSIIILIQQLRNFMCLVMLFFSSIYLSFLFYPLLIA